MLMLLFEILQGLVVPAEAGNESVVAAILPKDGQSVTLEQVREWAATILSHYALPRQIAILTEMPRSQIGKVLRRVVREELLAAREAASEAATSAAVSIVEYLPGARSHGGRDRQSGEVRLRGAVDRP